MRERVYSFGTDGGLAGIVTEPDESHNPSSQPAILLLNAGALHHVGQNRLNVQFARSIAALGFLTFRFDLSGIGDSIARKTAKSLNERSIGEIQEAMNFLQKTRKTENFVIIGLCTGADNAHRVAVADKRVCGAVLLDGYSYPTTRYYLQRYGGKIGNFAAWPRYIINRLNSIYRTVRRMRTRKSSDAASYFWTLPPKDRVTKELMLLVQRGVYLLEIFAGSNISYNYKDQFLDSFKQVDFGDQLRLIYYASADHTYSVSEDRHKLTTEIGDWLTTSFAQRHH